MRKNKKRILFFVLLILFLFNFSSLYAENKSDEHFDRAISRYLQNDLKGAIRELKETLKLGPLHPEAKKLLLAIMEEEESLKEKVSEELVLPGEYKAILNTIQNSLKEAREELDNLREEKKEAQEEAKSLSEELGSLKERVESLERGLKKSGEEKESAVLALAQTRTELNILKKKVEQQKVWRKKLEDKVAFFKKGAEKPWDPSLDNIIQ
jgi:chromosome segregation ATPase